MAKNFIQPGCSIDVTLAGTIASGVGYLVGSLFGVTKSAGVSGDVIAIATEGVFEVAKVSAQAWTVGVKIYWDDTAKLFTTVSTSNTLVGVATEAAANPSSVGRVRLGMVA